MRFLPALLLLALGASASAQPMWRLSSSRPGVALDVVKGIGDGFQIATDVEGNPRGEARPTLLHSAQILSARIPIRTGLTAVADLPTAYYSYRATGAFDVESGSHSEFGIGNPYVGVEARIQPDVILEGGVRLPFSSGGDDGFGTAANATGIRFLTETPEAYLNNTSSASAGVRFEPELRPGLALGVRAVPTVFLYSATHRVYMDGEDVPTEVRKTGFSLHYGARVVGHVGPAELTGGVIGRLNEGRLLDLYEPVTITLGASVGGLPVRPGLSARFPLGDEYRIWPDALVGLSLDAPLR